MGMTKPYVVGHITKLELEDGGDNEDYKSYYELVNKNT